MDEKGSGPEGRITEADLEVRKEVKGHSPRVEVGVDYYKDLLATPAVRDYANELKVDISSVKVVSY